MDTVPQKQRSSHHGTTASSGTPTAATAETLAGQDLEEASLSSCESDMTSPKKYFPGKYIDAWSRGHAYNIYWDYIHACSA